MKFLFILFFFSMSNILIYNFNKDSSINDWRIIDDGVMGGKSRGDFYINSDGNGVFEGTVSLANNGGFSSMRYVFDKINLSDQTRVVIKLKGDGKTYQFRIKDKLNSYYSYITTFKTSGYWEEVEINLKELYPSFRGRQLNLPNFKSDSFEEIVFLIGNKKKESFKLMIDKIELK
ncbi:CIA30 family protein [uncultured Flavobacterium sp.]|uniref:CIA30 family protein n=1 Tax=uncultured Flavobacterium sp. TaxID=165435 RepID=UPI0030CA3FEE